MCASKRNNSGDRKTLEVEADLPSVPSSWAELRRRWQQPDSRAERIDAYQQGRSSFIAQLLPEYAVALSTEDTLGLLRGRLGSTIDLALDAAFTDPERDDVTLPQPIRSPVAARGDSRWLRTSNMVGINVRTIGSFWNIIKYTLTVPEAHDSIHILPIWEPGVVASLYGIASWEINPEFFSEELAAAQPHLDTPGKQLRAVVNLLHATGRTVGMDVIPHTDRFSEIVLANPHYFEWLRRRGLEIVDHSADLHVQAQQRIYAFLKQEGPALASGEVPNSYEVFFSDDFGEAQRGTLLFGKPQNFEGREARRTALVAHLHGQGYEPVPATMAPPYRGLVVDTSPEGLKIDDNGQDWRDYVISEPQGMSRVFGPLTRFKLYERLDDNARWEVDFDRPRHAVWRYVCDRYAEVQQRYGFDFMRGDMSHVQMRAEGVPDAIDDHYDILREVKHSIQRDHGAPYFGYFAESFLAPRDVMAYGDEVEHLEACDADTTLGDLQSTPVGSEVFLRSLRFYDDVRVTRRVAPSFTVMTSDKDDPRFDGFYLAGGPLRLFCALFLTDMPSYVALGFETRDVHHEPAPNEHYTKLFVFHETSGPKATHGPYVWGKNGPLFSAITSLRWYAEGVWAEVQGRRFRWLIPPDPTVATSVFAWTQEEAPTHVFVANADTKSATPRFTLPEIPGVATNRVLRCEFSTEGAVAPTDAALSFNGTSYRVSSLAAGEARSYRIVPS